MQLIYGLLGFILGVAFTLFMFSEQIWNGRKVGYGENDIHPDKGVVSCDN